MKRSNTITDVIEWSLPIFPLLMTFWSLLMGLSALFRMYFKYWKNELRYGLGVSFQKTSFYASGLSEQELSTIQVSTGMVHCSLPFCYLGVPLNSRNLFIVTCEPLPPSEISPLLLVGQNSVLFWKIPPYQDGYCWDHIFLVLSLHSSQSLHQQDKFNV